MQVVVADARKTYGSRVVFSELNLTCRSGSITALTGPSGSGKTTLLATMAGFEPLDAGIVTIESPDIPLRRLGPRDVAWVPQGSNTIPSRSVVENVMIGALARGTPRWQARTRAEDALHAVGLGGLLHHKCRTLSGGELQRACLARALASQSCCILADEPSASLDAASTARLAEVLRVARFDGVIVLATHDPLLIAAADRVFDLRSEQLSTA